MYQITEFKYRLKQAIIVFLFLLLMIFVSKKNITIEINEKTSLLTSFEFAEDIIYFIIYTPEKEIKITDLKTINEIKNKLTFIGNSYEYKGEFNYELILGCVNENKIIESNLLIKDNYLINGNRVFILDFNIENYLKNLKK